MLYTLTNELTGIQANVYNQGPQCFEVEILDIAGDYIGGHFTSSLGEAVAYALQYS